MYVVKTIFKTYVLSVLMGIIYLSLTHHNFETNEIRYIVLALLIVNMILCVAYIVVILLPFHILFKGFICTCNFKEAVNKFLFYFTLLPLFFMGCCIAFGMESIKLGLQFSMLAFDISSIIFLGFIYSLKYKTLA